MKRGLDVLGALIGLIVFSPAILLIWVLVRVQLGHPVIFRQTRPGLHGRPFEILKFRTMRNIVDCQGRLLEDVERQTMLGQVLRSCSLDELPELWNVLRGDMSLVGPRPLLMEYLKLYTAMQFRRHEVRPGMTGWAQVNGRNALTWEEKFQLDVWYVDNRNLWLDLKILLWTLVKVVKREGINAGDESTMPKFTGSCSER